MNYKNISLFAFGTFAPLLALAQASSFSPGLPEGSYKGKFRGQDRGAVQLLTQKIKGCQGCFMAVILKDQKPFLGSNELQVQAYKALPQNDQVIDGVRTSSQYTLTPIGVDAEDGELTTPNDNPSLVLNITHEAGKAGVEFSVANAQSDNHTSFQSSMIFKGIESRFDLANGQEGRYKRAWACREEGTISVIGASTEDGSRSANVSWNGNRNESGGNFSLKEKAPGVFTFNAVSFLATGTQTKSIPQKIVIFVKVNGRQRALLANPKNSADVSELKIMTRD